MDGLKILKLAKEEVGIPIVSEIVSIRHLEEFDNTVDMIQIGARNMQNFELLKEVGKLKKPILLKKRTCKYYGRMVNERRIYFRQRQ